MYKLLAIFAFPLLLLACGGGGGGSSSSSTPATDVIANYIAVAIGGQQKIGVDVTEASPTYTNGCGFSSFAASDHATFEQQLRTMGATILVSSPTEFCATLNGETDCMKQINQAVVSDSRLPSSTAIKIYMPGLLANRYTNVVFNGDSVNGITNVFAKTKDSTIGTGGACTSTQPLQTSGAVNGSWSGYQLNYSPISKTGTTSAATATCTNQNCTIVGSRSASFVLTDFNNIGGWRTAIGASFLAGASISSDLQLLSMFTCSTPLDKTKSLENCSFFTFKR